MTLSPWTIYLWGIADQIRDALGPIIFVTSFLSVAGIIMSMAVQAEECDESVQVSVKKWRNAAISIMLCSIVGIAAIPSSKTIAMMVVLPAIVNSEPIQKDLPEVYKMAVDALKSQLAPTP